jgi:hypothetical protein
MFNPRFRTRTWGFRFSATDAAVILVLAVSACALARLGNELWLLLVIVAGHFFLFCNVFRVRRKFELVWAASFIFNTGLWLWFDEVTWLRIFLCQLPLTLVVVGAEIKSAHYHGVFASRLNRKLNGYLEGRIQ